MNPKYREPWEAVAGIRWREVVGEGWYDVHRPCEPAAVVHVLEAEGFGVRVEPAEVDGRTWEADPRREDAELFGPFESAADVDRWRRAKRKGQRVARTEGTQRPQSA